MGVLIAAPFWYKISFKIGIKYTALIGAVISFFTFISHLFIPIGPEGLVVTIIILTIFGLVDGALITMTMPIFSSVIDDATLKTGKRQEGLYNGTHLFFSRVGIAIQAIIFLLVRILTGYHSGLTSTTELFGLRLQMSIFPIIIIGTSIIIFWRLYSITPEILKANAM